MSALLEITVDRWADVLKENERDKDLITPDQLKKWNEFEVKTTARLKTIIENYDGKEFSDADRDWLQDLTQTIERSTRVSREDLEAQKREREAVEARKAEEERQKKLLAERKAQQVAQTKTSLLGKLKF